MRRPFIVPAVVLATLAACAGEPAVARATPSGAVYPAPREYPRGQFGVGSAATPAQIAAWNNDIGPDGAELPVGRGTVSEGAEIFRSQCAACHGAEGQGLDPLYPALIGRPAAGESFDFAADPKVPRTIGNYWPYATTLYDYIRRAMPLYTPGSLNADETYAVTAYLLAANKILADSATLDAAALRAVVMPARSRFVADDRSPTKP